MNQRWARIITEESVANPSMRRLVLIDQNGTPVKRSDPFTPQQAWSHYDYFAAEVQREGWTIVGAPELTTTEKRDPNITALWIVTLIVVVLLFAACVVLVYTTTFTFQSVPA
jgi:hypothetical protein